MPNSLASLIEKNQDKLVDQAATSIKVMYSFAFADVATEDLRDRLEHLFDNLIEVTREGAMEPTLVEHIAADVMVGPLYDGFDNNSITEEVLQIVDMVTNKLIESKLEADDREEARELLAKVIRTAKEIVNGNSRAAMEKKAAKRASRAGNEPV